MGKYTEALRKIEEERIKKIQDPQVVPNHLNYRNYVVGIAIVVLVAAIVIYSYGMYRGSQLNKKRVAAEMPAAVSPVHQVSNSDQNALLLENVENMMRLSQDPEKAADFYTVQLIAYEQEGAAKSEAQKLIDQGYRPLILRGSKYFKLCVGKFETKKEAETEMKNIKSTNSHFYQDAFIRLVKAKNRNGTTNN